MTNPSQGFTGSKGMFMKRVNAVALLISLAFLICFLVALGRYHDEVGAQDAAKNFNTNPSTVVSHSKVSDPATGTQVFPFPLFFVDDVVEKLTSITDELIKRKEVRTSADLRKELDRSEFAINLPVLSTVDLPTDELYRILSKSVFLVAGMTKPTDDDASWKTAFSTAFVVHEDGILSTSAHVFDHDDQDHGVVVMDVNKDVYPVVEILAANRKADTCIFRIGKKGLKPLPLGIAASPGTPIQVMGHPGDSFFFFSSGHLANYEKDDGELIWMNITADFGQGSSGGPVVDQKGNIVGQVSRTFTLYASGETSNRSRRRIRTRQSLDGADPKMDEDPVAPDEPVERRKKADPQMVFKACTPVTAIRGLVK